MKTSSDEKKFPGINQGKFNTLPLKHSKIDKIIITFMWITPIFDEINFAMTKAIHQINDKSNGSKAIAIGIKNI